MLELFKTLLTPDQIKIQKLTLEKTGLDRLQNEARMKQLMKEYPQLVESTNEGRIQTEPNRKDIEDALEDLRSSSADTNEGERKNMDYFERKFSIQKRQILDEMEHLVVRETDRTIKAINAGPHERIVDKV